MSVKGFLREKGMQVGTAVMLAAPAVMCAAGAVDGAEASGSSSVVKIISDAATGLKTDALSVSVLCSGALRCSGASSRAWPNNKVHHYLFSPCGDGLNPFPLFFS